MRHRATVLFFVTAIVAALAASGSASRVEGDASMKRIGPVVTVAVGSGWSLRAWRSTAGLCISYRPDQGMTFCHVGQPTGGSLFTFLRDLGRRTLVIGAVAPTVQRVKVKDKRGLSQTRIYASPRTLGTRLRFVRVLAQTGSPPRWQVVAYDANGKQVGLVGQGRP